jgi:two-component system CheB/CheR fusion protein
MREEPGIPAQLEPELSPPVKRRRIVVVEDNVDFAQSLAALLAGEGHQVATANEGSGALDLVARTAPDVVLLDIGLPEMDGFELARRIRQLGGRSPMLVAVSGYGDEANQRRARECGIDHYLVKPFWRDRLWQLLAVE